MKKLILVLISVILVFSMCSCDILSSGNSSDGDKNNKDDGISGNQFEQIAIEELPKSEGEEYDRVWKLTDISGGYITLAEFCKKLQKEGYLQDANPSEGKWMVDGNTEVNDDTPVKKGAVVKYRAEEQVILDIIKITVEVISSDGESKSQEFEFEGDDITLGELCESKLETTYEKTLEIGEWTRGDKPINKNTVLHDGDKIVFTQSKTSNNPNPDNPNPDNPNPDNPNPDNPNPDNPNPDNPNPDNPNPDNPNPDNPNPDNPNPDNPNPDNPNPDNPNPDNPNPGGSDDSGNTDSDKKFKAKVIINSANGVYESNYVFNGESVTVDYICRIVMQMAYEDTVRYGYWTVNGMRADGNSLVSAGAVVEFTNTGSSTNPDNPNPDDPNPDNPNPDDPNPDNPNPGIPDEDKITITVVLDFKDGDPLKGEFSFEEAPLILNDVCLQVVGESYSETILLGSWWIDGLEAAGADAVINDGAVVEFIAFDGVGEPDDGDCDHEWNGGYCPKCDTTCNHTEFNDAGECTNCGMVLGIINPTVTYEISVDGVFAGAGELIGVSVRLEDILVNFFGSDWYAMADVYAVYINGEPANMDTEVFDGSAITLERMVIDTPEYKEFFVYGVFYPEMPYENEFGEVYPDWYQNYCKQFEYLYSGTEGKVSVGMALDGSIGYGNCEDMYNVYLNGKLITDIYNVYVDETAYVVISPKELTFPEYTVTVNDSILGTTTEYKYNIPVFFAQIRDEIFGTRDLSGMQITVGYDSWDSSIYERGAFIAMDTPVTVKLRTTEIYLEIIGVTDKTQYTVKGVVPTFEEFLADYTDISDPSKYIFIYGDWDIAEEIPLDAKCPYYIIAIPTELIADNGFDVEYSFTNMYGDYFEGVIHCDDPAQMLAYLFNNSYEEFGYIDFYGYKVTVDGVKIDTMEKGAYFTLLYKDCKVEISPAYRVTVQINSPDACENKELEFDGKDVTIAQIFEEIGLNFEDYVCRISGMTVTDASMTLDMFMYGMDPVYMELTPTSISFSVNFIDSFGSYMTFDSDYYFEGVTADELMQWLSEMTGSTVTLDDYKIIFYDDSNGEEKIAIDITSGEYIWEYVPNPYYVETDGHRCYYVEVVSRSFAVEVNITNNTDVYINQIVEYKDSVSIEKILEDFGYEWSDVDWASDAYFGMGIDEGYIITQGTRVEIYLKQQ